MGEILQVFDVSLIATVGLIFFITLFGAYLRSSRRDPCLKAFADYHVTLERASGKVIWGVLELEATGLELTYRDSVQDANHVESSYVLYMSEFEDIQAIYRFVDDLSDEDRARRQKELARYFHPGPLVRMLRSTQHFFSLANDSMAEVLGMIMGRLKKPAGRYITDATDEHIKRFSTDIVGSVGSQFDPLLERFIGSKVVVDLIENDEAHEHVAIFKNYSPDFYELLDVQYPQHQQLGVPGQGEIDAKTLSVVSEEGVMRVTNHTKHPLLLQSLLHGGEEEMLNVVVDGEETIELHPKVVSEETTLNVRVVRELDMIVPRRRCAVRHRADHYAPSVIPEIIFDIGVMLRGDSRLEARETRLRSDLEEHPHSALLASNLGIVLMQQQEYAEAHTWLERAYNARHSLPDNGRRTLMLLHELKRRQAKTPAQTAQMAVSVQQHVVHTGVMPTSNGHAEGTVLVDPPVKA